MESVRHPAASSSRGRWRVGNFRFEPAPAKPKTPVQPHTIDVLRTTAMHRWWAVNGQASANERGLSGVAPWHGRCVRFTRILTKRSDSR